MKHTASTHFDGRQYDFHAVKVLEAERVVTAFDNRSACGPDFRADACLELRPLRELVEHPGERVRRRLVTRDGEGVHLSEHFALGEAGVGRLGKVRLSCTRGVQPDRSADAQCTLM